MHDLEDALIKRLTRLMQGQKMDTSRTLRRLLTRWATKTVAVFQQSGQALEWEQRQHLFTGGLPPGTHVWIAAYKGNRTAWYQSHLVRPFDIPNQPTLPSQGLAATLLVGRLIFHVLIQPLPPGSEVRTQYWIQPAIMRIWPPYSGSRLWAPRQAVDDEALFGFSASVGRWIELHAPRNLRSPQSP